MNETDRAAAIHQYLTKVTELFYSGHAIEHAYRGALESLVNSLDDVVAVNDPKRSEHGAPDFVFLKKSNQTIIRGHAEAKDITVDLDKTEKSEQMQRYHGYANLILTDYLEFRFFRNGEKYETISLGQVKAGTLYKTPENGERLMRELEAFLDQTPESIRSGRRLAQIMGGKARRIRDNIIGYLKDDTINSLEFDRIYEMMKKMLVHDLTPEKFADMYAQTLVYGLFVARYGDTSPDNFTRNEARDLVPASNPFLRHFFDHIVGPNFDARLAYIVDELCEIFSVSNVQEIVHKHLKIADQTTDAKDPIIHFYEDFLQEYDPAERKSMGAYYTPTPVVKYIVRQVDRILKEDFGLAKGLASTETISQTVDTQPWRKKGERKDRLTRDITMPRVQILDPAVGTATFLNETIKFIYESFRGQEGRWPSYVNDNLVKRLHGFELMMAPYTIAHLKLGMTLKETGVDKLNDRLGVYLTNTLEEGIPAQTDLFSFGLAEAVSEESRLAAEVKSERPVMVVMGNPPYSGESNNKTKYADSLVDKYKVEPGGQQRLQEKNYKWLGDDYVKFIAFAEGMVERNKSGIVAMITNHAYIDNPTFRGLRWELTKTFDRIYILDLHGNMLKNQKNSDENVFDIMQGVGIIIAVKYEREDKVSEKAEIFYSEVKGTRKDKFNYLNTATLDSFEHIDVDYDIYNFSPINLRLKSDYLKHVALSDLFVAKSNGLLTKRDGFIVDDNKEALIRRLDDFRNLDIADEHIMETYSLKNADKDKWNLSSARKALAVSYDPAKYITFQYRSFDKRYVYYDDNLIARSQQKLAKHMLGKDNLALVNARQTYGNTFAHAFIVDEIGDWNVAWNLGGCTYYPLYAYHDDGTRTSNFASTELSALTRQLTESYEPEDILDYIYAVLHSPSYRAKYKEFLKTDFPRVPVPTQAEFDRLVPLGRELRQLHLMKAPIIDDYNTTFPVAGDNEVEQIKYVVDESSSFSSADSDGRIVQQGKLGRVYLNATQYFGNVPDIAWNFYIGGYQPAQKWLKDRKGRTLTSDDLDHYQRIIRILLETDRLMQQIG